MVPTLFCLLIIFGFAFYVMTPAERGRLLRAVLAVIRQIVEAARHGRPECKPFRDALRARTPWALLTPALVVVNATIFVFMVFDPGALSDPQTLVGWGGNFGPRTTNGEWWRLVTAMFVHSGMLQLLVNVGALAQLGLILERLVGHFALAVVYVAAGVFASLVNLSSYPVAVSVGASGAIFGMYGLLLAAAMWGALHRSSVTIPVMALKRLGPAAVVFMLYSMTNDSLGIAAEFTALGAGFVCGLVLARDIGVRTAPARRVSAAMATTVAIAVAAGAPLRGLTDVRPEIEGIITLEEQTVSAYETGVDRFRNGRITAEALAQLIDRTIMPELQAADARLKALDGVPQQQQPLVAGAEEYLRLRQEAWRLRAEGLRKTNMLALGNAERTERMGEASRRLRAETEHRANMLTLGKAERTERASLEALQSIRPAVQK